jgi:hypothetical protein
MSVPAAAAKPPAWRGFRRAAPGHDIRSRCTAEPGWRRPRGAPRVCRIHDSADADDGEVRAESAAQFAQYGQGLLRERCAADAAPAPRLELAAQLRYLGAGIGGDDTVDVIPEQHPAEIVKFFRVEIRRDLHEQRHAPGVPVFEPTPLLLQGFEYTGERVRGLQFAQACGIRRREVDREVVRDVVEPDETMDVVAGGAFQWRVGVLADAHAADSAVARAPQALRT